MAAAHQQTLGMLARAPLEVLAERFGATLCWVDPGRPIPGSFWGEPEAGLVGANIHARIDTPVQSLLHELSHYVCMDAGRRERLNRNAGGDVEEECAVCYLQILLADSLEGFGRERSFGDMDAWGYSFREGSAAAWFHGDGASARDWLMEHGLVDADSQVTWRLRK